MLLLHISSETRWPDLCCFGRFLYRHLLMFYSQTASLMAKSVFQQNSDSGLLSLKSGISLHLYVNQLPNGAAQIPSKLSVFPIPFLLWVTCNFIFLLLKKKIKKKNPYLFSTCDSFSCLAGD